MITAQPQLIKKQQGFTLIELLVVIGILAVLLAIVLIAINPARQFAQANDTQRRSDVTAILNAVDQYAADNAGALPEDTPLPGNAADITTAAGGTGQAFCESLVTTYIAALPHDPKNGSFADCSDYNTGYRISVSSASAGTPRVTISALTPELSAVISVTR